MRFFTTMLVALLSILGACNLKAQVTVSHESTSTPASEITTGYYVIKAKYKTDSERWTYMSGTSTLFTTNEPTSLSNVWYIEAKDENTFYIKNVATSTYIKLNNLSSEATDADKGGNLTSTANKSEAAYFCANPDFQLNGSVEKMDNNAFTLYAGSKAENGVTRQHIHANSIGTTSMRMSSWSTTIGSENVGSSTVGQFVFYKASLKNEFSAPINQSTKRYYLMNAKYGVYISNDVTPTSDPTNAFTFYIEYQNSGVGNGFYMLKNENKKFNTGPGRIWIIDLTSNGADREYWEIIAQNAGKYCIKFYDNSKSYKYLTLGSATANANCVSNIASDDATSWYFIPANDEATAARDLTMTVKEGDNVHGNVATFSASYPVSLPEGSTAYTATYDEANNVINMTELAGNVVPANTGVLIKSETTGELAMKPTLETGTEVTDNKFSAVGDADYTFTDNENVYLLGKSNEGNLCFRLMNTEGTQTIGAHKAYIKLDNAIEAASLQINFGGDVTGINNAAVNGANTNVNVYYDLSGRRVMRPQHGLYIVNGKKVIIK